MNYLNCSVRRHDLTFLARMKKWVIWYPQTPILVSVITHGIWHFPSPYETCRCRLHLRPLSCIGILSQPVIGLIDDRGRVSFNIKNTYTHIIVRVLVYLKLYPVRTTCQKRFFYLNVINRVSVNGKSMVAILLLGFKVLVRSQTYLPHIPIK